MSAEERTKHYETSRPLDYRYVPRALMTTVRFALSSKVMSLQDPVKLSPQYYKILLGNDRVRVLEYHSTPGDKEPMHSHPPGVVYYLRSSKSKTTYPEGRVTEVEHKSGDIMWREAVTHASENIGSTDAHILAIELKDPPKR